jgi:hypothetical protein
MNEWLIISIVFLILVAAYRLGDYFGKKNIGTDKEAPMSRVSSIQAGLMGLLGVMLAFSFSLSSQRYEKRRELVIDESLKIGAAYFRAGLLPDTLKRNLRGLLEEFLDSRIQFYQPENTGEQMLEIQKKSENLEVLLWANTAKLGKSTPNLNTNVNILALNEMIDKTNTISSEFQTRVPISIFMLLVFISICTLLIIGYSNGITMKKNIGFAIILNLVLCSILLLIIDMDRPTNGFFRADTYGLSRLKREIQQYSVKAKEVNE